MNKEELIGFDDYKSIYSKPFELNLDYIRSQCHFMDKEDIYKWILSDGIRIINLKQALNEIRKYVLGAYEMKIYTKSASLDEENMQDILLIIDKVLGVDENENN